MVFPIPVGEAKRNTKEFYDALKEHEEYFIQLTANKIISILNERISENSRAGGSAASLKISDLYDNTTITIYERRFIFDALVHSKVRAAFQEAGYNVQHRLGRWASDETIIVQWDDTTVDFS